MTAAYKNALSIHDLTRRSTTFFFASGFYIFVFQFTTSQGGRPGRNGIEIKLNDLSIHDLTRRSTRCREETGHANGLSIHDLTRRSTRTGSAKQRGRRPFNS